jgi:hypothetical protein
MFAPLAAVTIGIAATTLRRRWREISRRHGFRREAQR